MPFRELIIGCGSKLDKRIIATKLSPYNFVNPTTLDIDRDHKPDVVHNLEDLPLPFDDNSFDEIHAYEVLEHTGAQGDYRFFFAQFSDFWRILKPGGYLCATVPRWDSMWAWGDPSHKRIICPGTLVFLSQAEYKRQVGKTPMSDFRYIYKADFEVVQSTLTDEHFYFVIKAIK